jgi:UrcA family protein
MKTRISIKAGIASAVWMLCAMAANAGSSVTLHVGDLDLSKPEIAAHVYTRIARSATLLCRDGISPWDAAKTSTLKRCVTESVESAVKRANQPALTALHLSKQQRSDLAGLTR